jgi:hypothetical protein
MFGGKHRRALALAVSLAATAVLGACSGDGEAAPEEPQLTRATLDGLAAATLTHVGEWDHRIVVAKNSRTSHTVAFNQSGPASPPDLLVTTWSEGGPFGENPTCDLPFGAIGMGVVTECKVRADGSLWLAVDDLSGHVSRGGMVVRDDGGVALALVDELGSVSEATVREILDDPLVGWQTSPKNNRAGAELDQIARIQGTIARVRPH